MDQKTAIVTGGGGASAGGSGRYIAHKLADQGYFIVVWDIDDDMGIDTLSFLKLRNKRAAYVHCDVTKEEQVKEAVAQTVEHTGRIDVLVNNAFWHADVQPPLHEVSLEDWDKHIDVNLKSVFLSCKYAIPHMLEQDKSVIVNIGTTGARRGELGYAAYAAANAGVESLTRSIAAQYGRQGLRCNCVVPGLVLNVQTEKMMEKMPQMAEAFAAIDRQALLEPGHGSGMDVAEAVGFLVSDASRWMTGESLVIDGGTISHNPTWADVAGI